MDRDTAVILTQTKSIAVSVLLTLLFGGFGLFYVSVLAGVIMSVVEIIAWVITILTFGLGIVLLIPCHIICLIWAIVGVQKHNEKLIATTTQSDQQP